MFTIHSFVHTHIPGFLPGRGKPLWVILYEMVFRRHIHVHSMHSEGVHMNGMCPYCPACTYTHHLPRDYYTYMMFMYMYMVTCMYYKEGF